MIGVYVSVNETPVVVETSDRVFLVLPVPPATNKRIKGTVRKSNSGKLYSGTYVTKLVKQYRDYVRVILTQHSLRPMEGDVGMSIRWYRERKAGDIQDRWKDLCDAIQSKQKCPKTKKLYDSGVGSYIDDAQIAEFIVRRDDTDPTRPRCEIEVYRL